MVSLRDLSHSPAFQNAVGTAGAWYLRLVWWTSRAVFHPPDVYDHLQMPAIVAMWHGQHFMAPFLKKRDDKFRAKVLISRHRDGAINAIAAERLGVQTIRGSGSHDGGFHKGGAAAFREMLEALAQGYNIAMTADVPKIARVCGMGVIKLAQHSGKPIYAVGIASSRRKVLNNWDRSAINLPFSRMGLVAGDPIWVARDADDAALQQARLQVENELNRVTAISYELADGKRSAPP